MRAYVYRGRKDNELYRYVADGTNYVGKAEVYILQNMKGEYKYVQKHLFDKYFEVLKK